MRTRSRSVVFGYLFANDSFTNLPLTELRCTVFFRSLAMAGILMPNVVELSSRIPEPEVWQCQCGSYTFWLYSTGLARCSECRTEALNMQGFWRVPAQAEDVDSKLAGLGNVLRLFQDCESAAED